MQIIARRYRVRSCLLFAEEQAIYRSWKRLLGNGGALCELLQTRRAENIFKQIFEKSFKLSSAN